MKDAIEAYELVCEARSEVFGPTDARTIAARASLGVAYSQDGRSRQAVEILEPIVQLDQLGDPRRSLAAGSALASSYEALGRADDGMELIEKIYAQSAEHFGSEHPTTLSIALNLALSYARSRGLDEALTLQMLSAEQMKSGLGADHPKALLASANLAMIFAGLGQNHEARQLLQSVVLRSESNPNVAPTDLAAWTVALNQLVAECADQ